MATTETLLTNLVAQKNALADNLVTKGVTAAHTEKLDTLVPKVLDISTAPTLSGTADATDVILGKTFYNTSTTKATGTMDLVVTPSYGALPIKTISWSGAVPVKIITNGVNIFVCDITGYIKCYNAELSLLWTAGISQGINDMIYIGNSIYVGCGTGTIGKFNATSGAFEGSVGLGYYIRSMTTDGVTLWVSANLYIFKLNAATLATIAYSTALSYMLDGIAYGNSVIYGVGATNNLLYYNSDTLAYVGATYCADACNKILHSPNSIIATGTGFKGAHLFNDSYASTGAISTPDFITSFCYDASYGYHIATATNIYRYTGTALQGKVLMLTETVVSICALGDYTYAITNVSSTYNIQKITSKTYQVCGKV